MKLFKIISGGQTGADFAGLKSAKKAGFATGGMVPKGCLTEIGSNTELVSIYGCFESKSDKYPPRTYDNVKNSDATLRLAYNFESAGEKITLKAIHGYNQKFFDVDMTKLPDPKTVVSWIVENKISILNIAGNRESKHPGIGTEVELFLDEVFNSYINLINN
jgi:hypothetical protein